MPRPKGGALKKIDFSSLQDIMVPYRRVSTREQGDNGYSLPAQKTKIGGYLDFTERRALTWDCFDVQSGKDDNRDGLDAALAHVRAGRAGGIIVSKLDRLSRSLLDFATLLAAAQKEGWNVVLMDLKIDLLSPMGEFMAIIVAAVAQLERRLISQRTKEGLEEARSQGVQIGRPRTMTDDLLIEIIDAYLRDPSYSGIARMLNEQNVPTVGGGREWYPARIRKIVYSRDGQKVIQARQGMAA